MAGKNNTVKVISLPAPVKVGSVVSAQTPNYGSPARPLPPAPENLVLATSIEQRAVTSRAQISATWTKPTGVQPERYTVQWSTDPAFPNDETNGQSAAGPSATIPNLVIATLYYVRVLAWVHNAPGEWSDAVSITTANDIVPPDPPGIPTWTWLDTGDLIVQAAEPTNTNYHWLEITIWSDATKTTLLTTAYFVGGTYIWTLAENKRVTGSSGDAAVYIEVRSQSWTGYFSSAVVPAVQPNRPAPSAPTSLTTSWASDTGTAGPDCTITCTAPAGAVRYVWTIDGTTIPSSVPRLVFSLDTNRAQHSGSPDAVLSISVVAYDALGQASPTASTTATNAAPAAPTITITNGPSQIVATVTSAPPPDFQAYEYTWKLGGVTQTTIESASATNQYEVSATGTYTVVVRVKDVFGQYSPTTTSSSVFLDPLTYAILAATAAYTDSPGNTPSTLAELKNNNTASGGVTYGASASWQWVQVQRPLIDRYYVSTTVATAGIGYIATSADGVNWLFWTGPLAGDGRTLVLVSSTPQALGGANETTAQTNAVTLPTSTTGRLDLPQITEARYVRLGFKMTAGGTLREFYPRRYLQLDDLDAGVIRGMTISGGQFICNSLSGLSADLGTITAGTVTGATIQTATSGARVVLSSAANGGLIGYGASDTYNPSTGSGTYQILWKATDGGLYAGGGKVVLNANGIRMVPENSSFSDVRWEQSSVSALSVNANYDGSGGTSHGYVVNGVGWTTASKYGQLLLRSSGRTVSGGPFGPNGVDKWSAIYIGAGTDPATTYSDGWYFVSKIGSDPVSTAASLTTGGTFVTAGGVSVGGGLNVSTTGASAGQIKTSGDVSIATGLNVGTGSGAGTGGIHASASASGGTVAGYIKNTGGTAAGTLTRWSIGQTNSESVAILIQFAHDTDTATILNRKSGTGTLELLTTGGGIIIRNDGMVSMGGSGASTDRLRIFGQGTTSSTFGLVVKDSGSNNTCYVRDDGAGFLKAAAWTYGSDRRLKENIRPLSRKLPSLLALRPVAFDYIDGQRDQFGFIAQEVQEVLPELVSIIDTPLAEGEYGPQPGFLGLQTTNLIPMLVQAMQELVTTYQADMVDLRYQIASLQAQLAG